MGCTPPPGRHALELFGGVPVPVGPPQVVDIGFVASVPFAVDNRTSSITQQCTDQVSWTALRDG